MSSDYGVPWVETLSTNDGLSNTHWSQTLAISRSGKYVYCGGGGGLPARSFTSTDYGVSFTFGGSSLFRVSSAISDNGDVISVTNNGSYYITQLSVNNSDIYLGNGYSVISQTSLSYNPSPGITNGWVSVSPDGFFYNPNPNSSFRYCSIIRTTPEVFEQVVYGYEGYVYACSTTAIYETKYGFVMVKGILWNNKKYVSIKRSKSSLYFIRKWRHNKTFTNIYTRNIRICWFPILFGFNHNMICK